MFEHVRKGEHETQNGMNETPVLNQDYGRKIFLDSMNFPRHANTPHTLLSMHTARPSRKTFWPADITDFSPLEEAR
jgi:hypothetical protein